MISEIDARKALSQILKTSRAESKPAECFICKKTQTSFCNSHSVPRMILDNIATSGCLLYSVTLVDLPIIDLEKGINNSGTFHFICKECDSSFFSTYENEQNLSTSITNKMLAEIAIKYYLMQMSKRHLESSLYNIISQNIKGKDVLDECHTLDLQNADFNYRRAKKIIDKELKSGYKIILYEKLPYVVPIAAQTGICLYKDLDDTIVNNIYNLDKTIRMQNMHLCIFPLKIESVIILFYHKDDRNYVSFEKKFLKKTLGEQLKIINYLLFKETENYYISKQLPAKVLNNTNLRNLSRQNHMGLDFNILNKENVPNANKIIIGIDDVPNLLSEEYKLALPNTETR